MPKSSATAAAPKSDSKPAKKGGKKKAAEEEVLEGDAPATTETLESLEEAETEEEKNILDLIEEVEFEVPDFEQDEKTAQVVIVSPGQAKYLINKFCSRNRPVRPNTVIQYKGRVLRGGFEDFTGNQLGFCRFDDGTRSIVNGQHQLRALWAAAAELLNNPEIDTNLSDELQLEMVMVTGISPAGVSLLDHGTPRSHTDVVYSTDLFSGPDVEAKDVKFLSNTYSTAAKIVWFREKYGQGVMSRRKFEFDELQRIADSKEFDYLKKAVLHIKKLNEDDPRVCKPRVGVNASYLAAAAFAVYRAAGKGRAEQFLEEVGSYYKNLGEDKTSLKVEDGNGLYQALSRYNAQTLAGKREERLHCIMAGAAAFLLGTKYDTPGKVPTLGIVHPTLGGEDQVGEFQFVWVDTRDGHVLTDEEIEVAELPEAGYPEKFKETSPGAMKYVQKIGHFGCERR